MANKTPKPEFKKESARIKEQLDQKSEGQHRAALSANKILDEIANKRGANEEINALPWMDPAAKAKIIAEEERNIRDRLIPQHRKAQQTYTLETAARRRAVAEQFSTDYATTLREDVSRSVIHDYKGKQNVKEQASLLSRYGKSHVEDRLQKEQEYHQRIQEDYSKQLGFVATRVEGGKAPTAKQIQSLRRKEEEIDQQRRRIAVLEQADVFARKNLPDYDTLGQKMLDLGSTKYRAESGLSKLNRADLAKERQSLEQQQGAVVGEFLKTGARSQSIEKEIAGLGTSRADQAKKVKLEEEFAELGKGAGKLTDTFAALQKLLENNNKLQASLPGNRAIGAISALARPAMELGQGILEGVSDIGISRPRLQVQAKAQAASLNASNVQRLVAAGHGDLQSMMMLSGSGLKDVLDKAEGVGGTQKGVGIGSGLLSAAGGVLGGIATRSALLGGAARLGVGVVAGGTAATTLPAVAATAGLMVLGAGLSRAVGKFGTAKETGDVARLQMTQLGTQQLEALTQAPMAVMGPALDYTRGMYRAGARMGGGSATALYDSTTKGGQSFLNKAVPLGLDVFQAPALAELGGRTMGAAFNRGTLLQAQKFENAKMGTKEDYISQRGVLSGFVSNDAEMLNKLTNAVEKGAANGTLKGTGGGRALEALTRAVSSMGGKAGMLYGNNAFENISNRVVKATADPKDWRSVGRAEAGLENVAGNMAQGWNSASESPLGVMPAARVVRGVMGAGRPALLGTLDKMDQETKMQFIRALQELRSSKGGKMTSEQASKAGLTKIPGFATAAMDPGTGDYDYGKLGSLPEDILETMMGGTPGLGATFLGGKTVSTKTMMNISDYMKKNPKAKAPQIQKALKLTPDEFMANVGGLEMVSMMGAEGLGLPSVYYTPGKLSKGKDPKDKRPEQESNEALGAARSTAQMLQAANQITEKLGGMVANAGKFSEQFLKMTEDPSTMVKAITSAMSDSLKGVVSQMEFPGTVNMTISGKLNINGKNFDNTGTEGNTPSQKPTPRPQMGVEDLDQFNTPKVKSKVNINTQQGQPNTKVGDR